MGKGKKGNKSKGKKNDNSKPDDDSQRPSPGQAINQHGDQDQQQESSGPSSSRGLNESMLGLDVSGDQSSSLVQRTTSTSTNDTPLPPVSEPDLDLPAADELKELSTEPKGYMMRIKKPAKFLKLQGRVQGGHATRPEFAPSPLSVWSNYLSLDLFEGTSLYIYEVEGMQSSWTRPKKKVLMERFIQKCNLLAQQRGSFVTDYNKRIIAFSDLSTHGGRDAIDEGDQTPIAEISVDNHNAKTRTSEALPLQLLFKGTVAFDDFNEFCWNNEAHQRPNIDSDLISSINLVISDIMQRRSDENALFIGTNKVYNKRGWDDLEQDNKITIRGFNFGVQPGLGYPLLNVNPITTTFHKAITVAQYVSGRDDLRKHLMGVRVWLTMERMNVDQDHEEDLDEPARRFKTIAGFGGAANEQIAYKNCTVWQHMEYYETSGNEQSLCVNLGGQEGKEQWFLAEDLHIIPGQPFRGDTKPLATQIIRKACRTPNENKSLIVKEFLPFLGLKNSEEKSCSLPGIIEIHPQLQEIPAHQAVSTPIQYSTGEATTRPREGQWKLETQRFLDVRNKFEGHAFFLLANYRTNKFKGAPTDRYLRFFHDHVTANGVAGLSPFSGLNKSNSATVYSFDISKLTEQIKAAKAGGAALVVLILPRDKLPDQKNYARFKAVADQIVGVKSLCLNEFKISNAFKHNAIPEKITVAHAFAGYVRNVGMKLNVRLGNANHTAPQTVLENLIPGFKDDKNVMILGADVVHLGHAAPIGTPSIAAVVGTINSQFAAYRGSARRQEGKTEIIAEMEDMVKERLLAYRKDSGQLPSRILYYRDGIDEGQWVQVRQIETDAIRRAYGKLAQPSDPPVKVTTIVVTKRHHTRFYPKDNKNQIPNGNCAPGTVVDKGVCMPYNWDFFLISHNAIKGTARPTHYIILQDDNDFGAAQIQNLTNVLCSTYARSTTAVSYVPAAYYADHLCERVKQYLRPIFDNEIGTQDVQTVSDQMWGRGGRLGGNPWRAELDDSMFWI